MVEKTNGSLYPLSSRQKEIWFEQILYPDVPLYNHGGYVRIDGEIHPDFFEKALQRVVDRNDALRMVLHRGDPLPMLEFRDRVRAHVALCDFSKKTDPYNDAVRWMKEEMDRPLELYGNVMFRFRLIRISGRDHIWFAKYHQIILDERSHLLLVQQTADAYGQLAKEKRLRKGNVRTYAAFIQNDRAYLESEKSAKDERFWLKKFKDFPAPLFPAVGANRAERQHDTHLRLKQPFYRRLTAFAGKNRAGPISIFIGALCCYFLKTAGKEDLTVGLTVHNRRPAAFGKTIGPFAAVRPLRLRFETGSSFMELLTSIRKELEKDARHLRFPLSEINNRLGILNDGNQQLFDVVLSHEQYDDTPDFNGHPARLELFSNRYQQGRLGIYIRAYPERQDVRIDFLYDPSVFGDAEMMFIRDRFRFILEEIPKRSDVPLKRFGILPWDERRRIIHEFNDTAKEYPRGKTIADLLEEQVEKTPDRVAVMFRDQSLTYRRLNIRANRLAHYLQSLGVGKGVIVGLHLLPGLEMIVGLLGILKSGGAYLPLDPNYPQKRLSFMANDADISLLLTLDKWKNAIPGRGFRIVSTDSQRDTFDSFGPENPSRETDSDSLAYVMYTSGSTGRPKGVMGLHRGAINRFSWMWHAYPFQDNEVCCQKTSLCFIDSLWELFGSILQGVPLVIIPEHTVQNPHMLVQTLSDFRVTRTVSVPSLLRELLNLYTDLQQRLPLMKLWVSSGEPLPYDLCRRFYEAMPDSILLNLYGSSEVTADATFFDTRLLEEITPKVSIGRPISNTNAYILNSEMEPTPISIAGELYIGGEGLARGYMNRPDMTETAFLPNPFLGDPQERIYKTGDLARYLPDGNIEFLGRDDHQINVRGYRIEVGEIEYRLLENPSVKNAVVVARMIREDTIELVAYVVCDGELFVEDLRSHLKSTLPDFMIPAYFVHLDRIPLNPNGKVDKQALPDPKVSRIDLKQQFLEPRDEMEEKLAEIWKTVLDIDTVGVLDNFFEMGGQSILAIRMMSKIQKEFGYELAPSALFQNATIAEMSRFLQQHPETPCRLILTALQPHGSRNPFFCVPGAGGNVIYFYLLSHHLGKDQPFYGLQAVGLDGKTEPHRSVEDMAFHYMEEMLAFKPEGTYLLGGHSFGGWVAFEIAQQLIRRGCKVGQLAVIDGFAPDWFETPSNGSRDWDDARWLMEIAGFIESLFGKAPDNDIDLDDVPKSHDPLDLFKHRLQELHEFFKDINTDQIRGLLNVFKVNYQMSYAPKHFTPLPITVFRSEDILLEGTDTVKAMDIRSKPDLGWAKYSKGPVDIVRISGDHMTIMVEPGVNLLAKRLRDCLDKCNILETIPVSSP